MASHNSRSGGLPLHVLGLMATCLLLSIRDSAILLVPPSPQPLVMDEDGERGLVEEAIERDGPLELLAITLDEWWQSLHPPKENP